MAQSPVQDPNKTSHPGDERQTPPTPETPSWRQYAGMGTEFAGALCGLTLLGVWIDRHYETGLRGTLICGGLGLVGGLYNFIRQAMALSRTTTTTRKGDGNP